jgi:hypothetical protein
LGSHNSSPFQVRKILYEAIASAFAHKNSVELEFRYVSPVLFTIWCLSAHSSKILMREPDGRIIVASLIAEKRRFYLRQYPLPLGAAPLVWRPFR